jgi:hypothetical protein
LKFLDIPGDLLQQFHYTQWVGKGSRNERSGVLEAVELAREEFETHGKSRVKMLEIHSKGA